MDRSLTLDAALAAHREGNLAETIRACREAIAAGIEDATVETMLGTALAQSGAPREGLPRLLRAVALEPQDAGLFEHLGACLDLLGLRLLSGFVYLRSAAVSIGAGTALATAGSGFVELKAFPGGLRLLRRALALSPDRAKWWAVAGEGMLDIGRADVAITCFRRALTLGLERTRALDRVAEALLRLDRVEQASMMFEEMMAPVRASRWYRPNLAASAAASDSLSFRVTSDPKLRHDTQQLEYLMAKGVLPTSFGEIADGYRAVLQGHAARPPDQNWYQMSEAERRPISAAYNRVVHLYRPKAFGSEVMNDAVDWQAAERRYAESTAGIVVIDDLLSVPALAELQRYCLESTIWFDDRHPGGYLGALLRDGLAAPLLLRVARELSRRLPSILRDLPLRQMWAYKYDSRLEGTGLHADAAAINVNFWITPDEANLSKGRGGIVVFDRRAPPEWDFAKYNNDQAAIRGFLAESGAGDVAVPYRCNRAVIFHSDLFHKTDDLHFRDDYVSRRINVTMLFGDRGG